MVQKNNRAGWWVLVILWMGLIYFVSSRPDLRSSFQPLWDFILRKCAHALEYGILATLLAQAIRPASRLNERTMVLAVIGASLYAMTDEFHQTFIHGRHGSPIDWLIDTAGAALLVWLWSRRQGRAKAA